MAYPDVRFILATVLLAGVLTVPAEAADDSAIRVSIANTERTADAAVRLNVVDGDVKTTFRVHANLNRVSLAAGCSSGYVIAARDPYGPLLVGLRRGQAEAAFALRATQMLIRGEEVLMLPFQPVSSPSPETALISRVSLQSLCALPDQEAAALMTTGARGWGLGRQVYFREDAEIALRPNPFVAADGRVLYLVVTRNDGAFVVACGAEACTETPLFDDPRQREIVPFSTFDFDASQPHARPSYRVESWSMLGATLQIKLQLPMSATVPRTQRLDISVQLP